MTVKLKPAEKIVGRLYVVISEDAYYYSKGEIIKMIYDDGSDMPEFVSLSSDEQAWVEMESVALLTEDTEEEAPPAEKIEGRKYKVVNSNNLHNWTVGTVVTLISDDGTEWPRFVDSANNACYLLMNKVELLPEHVSKEEFLQLEEGDKITLVSELKHGDGYKTYCALAMTELAGSTFTISEIAEQYNYARVAEVAWVFSYDMVAKIIKKEDTDDIMDNPELKCGDVIVRRNVYDPEYTVITRFLMFSDGCMCAHSILYTKSGDFMSDAAQEGVREWRMATSEEVNKLETEERQRNKEFTGAIVNEKGTVIKAGNYYYEETCDIPTVCKVISVDSKRNQFISYFANLESGYYESAVARDMSSSKIYINALVPADLHDINMFKQIKSGNKILVGSKYSINSPTGDRVEVNVTGKDDRNFNVTYVSQFNNKVTDNLAIESNIWTDAELIKE